MNIKSVRSRKCKLQLDRWTRFANKRSGLPPWCMKDRNHVNHMPLTQIKSKCDWCGTGFTQTTSGRKMSTIEKVNSSWSCCKVNFFVQKKRFFDMKMFPKLKMVPKRSLMENVLEWARWVGRGWMTLFDNARILKTHGNCIPSKITLSHRHRQIVFSNHLGDSRRRWLGELAATCPSTGRDALQLFNHQVLEGRHALLSGRTKKKVTKEVQSQNDMLHHFVCNKGSTYHLKREPQAETLTRSATSLQGWEKCFFSGLNTE